MQNSLFLKLGVSEDLVRALNKHKIFEPTPIQSKSIPLLIQKNNVMAKAPTGTGKTAAFAIPFVELLKKDISTAKPRLLVLSPTRELSEQILNTFKYLTAGTDLKSVLIIGGEKESRQLHMLKTGVDIVVATPGRLHDLIRHEKFDCSDLKYFVLDEGDMMLDMGFLPTIKFIYSKLPANTQMALFSATIPDNIKSLASAMMPDYKFVEAETNNQGHKSIVQKFSYIDNNSKKYLLASVVNKNQNRSIMVFCNKKRCADFVTYFLNRAGFRARSIHGDKPQYLRKKIIHAFKSGDCNVLVATDVAARGIHVDNIGLVINYDVPNNVDTYVHRMGRTGRANNVGECISFVAFAEHEKMNAILKRMNNQIEMIKVNEKDLKASISQNEALRHHPSYGIQARRKSNAKMNINAKRPSNQRNSNSLFKNAPFSGNFMRERAIGSTMKSKLRNAEKKLIKREDDWQNNL